MSEQRSNAFRRYQHDLALFSRDVVGVPLWAYQSEWANYALRWLVRGAMRRLWWRWRGRAARMRPVRSWRRRFWRFAVTGGSLVKCAPTWKPQIVNSKLRLEARAAAVQQKLPFLKFRPSMGYLYKCLNAVIQFLSAAPEANVVGATASLLLEVDEAQDVAATKYDKDFTPMRASTGALAIFYGTPWTDTTLLEQMKLAVLEGRIPGRVFTVGWERVAAENPAYGRFVEREMARLGAAHPLIRTQYRMELLPEAGRLLGAQQLALMAGDHERRETDRREMGGSGAGFCGRPLDKLGERD